MTTEISRGAVTASTAEGRLQGGGKGKTKPDDVGICIVLWRTDSKKKIRSFCGGAVPVDEGAQEGAHVPARETAEKERKEGLAGGLARRFSDRKKDGGGMKYPWLA